MNTKLKWFLNALGLVLCVAGLIYLSFRITELYSTLDVSEISRFQWGIFAALMITYGCSNLFLTRAWKEIIGHLGDSKSMSWAIKVFGISQIAKYIPGNIFQFAGRQAIGVTSGAKSSALLKSLVWEICLLSGSGAMFAVLLAPLVIAEFGLFLMLMLFATIVIAAQMVVKKYLGAAICRAALSHFSFLLLSGLIFAATIAALSNRGVTIIEVSIISGAYVVAWLVGFLVPGAPAGLGIRETVLLTLLSNMIPASVLLLAIIISRVTTAGGDFLFFLFAFFQKLVQPNVEEHSNLTQ